MTGRLLFLILTVTILGCDQTADVPISRSAPTRSATQVSPTVPEPQGIELSEVRVTPRLPTDVDVILLSGGHNGSDMGENDYWMLAVNKDGTDLRRIVRREGRSPSLAPDARRVAFVCGNGTFRRAGICVMDLDGSDHQRLMNDRVEDGAPAYSHEGWIAFHRWTDKAFDLFKIRDDGSGLTRLTGTGGRDPAWSSDGRWIVYSSCCEKQTRGLWIIDNEGQRTVQLTQGPDSEPDWSSDGKSIVFTRGREWGKTSVWMIDISTGKENRVLRRASQPAWSPDGSEILLLRHIGGRLHISSVHPDGSQIRRLVSDRFDEPGGICSPQDGLCVFLEPEW